jgi:hypothetical protein
MVCGSVPRWGSTARLGRRRPTAASNRFDKAARTQRRRDCAPPGRRRPHVRGQPAELDVLAGVRRRWASVRIGVSRPVVSRCLRHPGRSGACSCPLGAAECTLDDIMSIIGCALNCVITRPRSRSACLSPCRHGAVCSVGECERDCRSADACRCGRRVRSRLSTSGGSRGPSVSARRPFRLVCFQCSQPPSGRAPTSRLRHPVTSR